MSQLPIIHQLPVNEKVIAIGFDDGPDEQFTPAILDILAKVNGKATFFVIGIHLEKLPQLAKRILAEQHEIGNHTYEHPQLANMTTEEIEAELLKQEAAIFDHLQIKPTVFRPPYFSFDEKVEAVVAKLGYKITAGCANGAATDWENPGVDHIVEHTVNTIAPGQILILHDGFGDRSQTVAALQIIVDKLTAEGYRFVTISELIELSNAQAN